MMLDDLLARDLRLVICGYAVGDYSAQTGHYYARPGNRFWSTMAECNFTNRLLRPEEDSLLLSYGIGLTDLVKDQAGPDRRIAVTTQHVEELQGKLSEWKPKVLCFNGKRVAMAVLDRRNLDYGFQHERISDVRTYVATSTSGANAHRNIDTWCRLAAVI